MLPDAADRLSDVLGRHVEPLVRPYACRGARTVVIAMGSVLGTLAEVVDDRLARGDRVGALGITCFRPFPAAAVRAAVDGADEVLVVERSLAAGEDGPLTAEVARALAGSGPRVRTVVAGLGGRPVTGAACTTCSTGRRTAGWVPGRSWTSTTPSSTGSCSGRPQPRRWHRDRTDARRPAGRHARRRQPAAAAVPTDGGVRPGPAQAASPAVTGPAAAAARRWPPGSSWTPRTGPPTASW